MIAPPRRSGKPSSREGNIIRIFEKYNTNTYLTKYSSNFWVFCNPAGGPRAQTQMHGILAMMTRPINLRVRPVGHSQTREGRAFLYLSILSDSGRCTWSRAFSESGSVEVGQQPAWRRRPAPLHGRFNRAHLPHLPAHEGERSTQCEAALRDGRGASSDSPHRT